MTLTRFVFCLLFVVCGLTGTAGAQDEEERPATSSIAGTVYGASSTPIPGAHVTVVRTDINLDQSAETDAQGRYSIVGLTAGNYSVAISAEGYQPFQKDSLDLGDGDEQRLDANLQPVPEADSDKDDTSDPPQLMGYGHVSAKLGLAERLFRLRFA
jgi:hypothetical protein